MKTKRFFTALAISLISSTITANAEQIFGDIQPEQRNDSVMTVNIYAEGDDLAGIKEQLKGVNGLNNSNFDEAGELTSVEVIYSNIAETHDAIAKRLSDGIKALGLTSLVNTDSEGSHIEIYAEPSDDPTSQNLKRMVVLVIDNNEATAVLLEGNITPPNDNNSEN